MIGDNMFTNKTEVQAKEEILGLVKEYCDTFHIKKNYEEWDRIPYASRVYDQCRDDESRRQLIRVLAHIRKIWLTLVHPLT